MIKGIICLLIGHLTFFCAAQQSPKNFELAILSMNKVNQPTIDLIFSKLDSGYLVTWATLEYAIERLDTIRKKIVFIDSLLKYDFWDTGMKLKLVYKKLFYYRNGDEELSRKSADSLIVSTLQTNYALFKENYYETLRDYTTWHNELGRCYLKTFWNLDKAESAYIEVLRVPFYEIRDGKTMYHIRELHIQAIIGRLEAARGNAFRLKNILIPYSLEQDAFPIYKAYMEELGEKVEEPKYPPILIKKN
jgi:hypothetical protein